MSRHGFHLAQLNVARVREPLDSPLMADFLARLPPVYAAAEAAPGFVWRLKQEDVSAALARVQTDPQLFVTLSLWESVGSLSDYVYGAEHGPPLRERGKWFERAEGHVYVLWWVARGALPRVEQGLARLKHLNLHGPTPRAFNFARAFPPPEV